MNKKIMGTAVIALVIGIGAGYVGATSLHAAPRAQNARGNFTGAAGTAFAGRTGMGANGGFLTGTVAAKDSGSITLNTRDGSSHVVLISPATSVAKSVSGSQADVSVGATIIVSGMTNSDGSVSASLIQLRPAAPSVVQ